MTAKKTKVGLLTDSNQRCARKSDGDLEPATSNRLMGSVTTVLVVSQISMTIVLILSTSNIIAVRHIVLKIYEK